MTKKKRIRKHIVEKSFAKKSFKVERLADKEPMNITKHS